MQAECTVSYSDILFAGTVYEIADLPSVPGYVSVRRVGDSTLVVEPNPPPTGGFAKIFWPSAWFRLVPGDGSPKELPCTTCRRPNDVGVATCWSCGEDPRRKLP